MIYVLRNRIEKLDFLRKDVDGIVLFNRIPEQLRDPNFFYFTGYDVQGVFHYDFKKPMIFTSAMERPRIRGNVRTMRKLDDFLKTLDGKIAVDKQTITAGMADKLSKKLQLRDVSGPLEQIRAVKDREEIKIIRRAEDISGKAYEKVMKENIFKFTEAELRALIEYDIMRRGAEPAFPTIVATEENIAKPHHVPTIKRIGKTLLIDFGVRWQGYCTDISRTFNSKYEEKIKKTLAALEEKMKPGVKASSLDALSRKLLGSDAKKFITNLGHGIGIEVHEKPSISASSKDVLKKDMVIAIEPAIYVKNGIRIENDYLITEDGCENLTEF
jgi:Xaa-Pro dipeptidase